MKFLMLLLLSVSSSSLYAFTPVPPLRPGTMEYQETEESLDVADKSTHVRALEFQFKQVSGLLAVMEVLPSGNHADLGLRMNGEIYQIPTRFYSVDNFQRFFTLDGSGGTTPGVYLGQTGFRINRNTTEIERVTVTLRLAELGGRILRTLEYSESVAPARGREFLETHPRVTVSKSLFGSSAYENRNHTPMATTLKPDSLIAQHWDSYTPEQTFSNAEAHPDLPFHYLNWQFRGLAGKIFVPGRGMMPVNDSYMFLKVKGFYFKIRFDFLETDYWSSFKLLGGNEPGIYFIQRGFRRLGNGYELERVVAHIRIADRHGNPLSELEYHEEVFPTLFADSELMIEKHAW